VTGGRAPSFRDLSVGETAAPDVSGECGGGKPARHREPLKRGGRDSPADKSQKRPAREPRNKRKAPAIPFTELEKAKMILFA